MALTCTKAQLADASRIAAIYMLVFGSNAMLLAQFPSEHSRRDLWSTIERKVRADIEDPNMTVLVVRPGESTSASGIVAFSIWAHPIKPGEKSTETPWSWPDSADMTMIQGWSNAVARKQDKLIGSRPCYRLNFIGTDPRFGKRGAASMMVQWGISQSRKDHVPIYLESTVEAKHFYSKKGFRLIEEISLQIPSSNPGLPELYSETAFILEPRADSFGHEEGKGERVRANLEGNHMIVMEEGTA